MPRLILDARDVSTYPELVAAFNKGCVGAHKCAEVIWLRSALVSELWKNWKGQHPDDPYPFLFKGVKVEEFP